MRKVVSYPHDYKPMPQKGTRVQKRAPIKQDTKPIE